MKKILLLIFAISAVGVLVYGSEYLVVKTGDTITIFSIFVKPDGVEKITKEMIHSKDLPDHPISERNPLLSVVSDDYTYDSRDEILNAELCEKFKSKIDKERNQLFFFLELKQDSLRHYKAENKALHSEINFLKDVSILLEGEKEKLEKKLVLEMGQVKLYKAISFITIAIITLIAVGLLIIGLRSLGFFRKEVRKN